MTRRPLLLSRRDYLGKSKTGIVVSREVRQSPMGQHRHEFFEIAVILSGSAIHAAGGFRHRIGGGDVLFLDLHRTHGYEDPHSLNLINILIREDVMNRIGRELAERPGFHALFTLSRSRSDRGYRQHLRLSPRETEQIAEWADRIEEAARSGPATIRTPRLLQEAYLTLIIDILCRKHERSRPRPSPDQGKVRAQAQISPGLYRHTGPGLGRVLSWMEANLAQPLRIADLAAKAGMSQRTFQRAFLAATSLPPHAYLIRARLSRAVDRLASATHGETVTEIAQECGFEDSNYFSRSFRQFAGKSPSAYRLAQKKSQGRSVAPPRK